MFTAAVELEIRRRGRGTALPISNKTNKIRASWPLRRKRIQKSRTSYSEKREEKKTRLMDKVNNVN